MAKKSKILIGENQKYGLLLLVISTIIWFMKPKNQECENWYNILCHFGSFFQAPIYASVEFLFLGLTTILAVVGVYYLIKK